ncbi:MAG: hypothetical protein ACK40S_11325 [Burkholderiaceae bacterium]
MVLVKTSAGQQLLKDRHGALTPRQRSAFILFDGKRTVADVLAATAAMGITEADIQAMLDLGVLAPQGQESAPAPAPAAEAVAAPTSGSEQDTGRSMMQRFQDAYPVATELTAGLGLRGFRLNLAVEGAMNYEALAALAPQIREAVGEAKYERLRKALFA